MGIQVGTLGNHNFDRGHRASPVDDRPRRRADQRRSPRVAVQYVSANLANLDDNLDGRRDFKIFDVGGIKVGVVGVTNPEAPGLVSPGSFGTIGSDRPRTAAANRAKAAAKQAGAQVVVAITHMGVRGFTAGQPFGELVDFANNVGGFDVDLR